MLNKFGVFELTFKPVGSVWPQMLNLPFFDWWSYLPQICPEWQSGEWWSRSFQESSLHSHPQSLQLKNETNFLKLNLFSYYFSKKFYWPLRGNPRFGIYIELSAQHLQGINESEKILNDPSSHSQHIIKTESFTIGT